jgi:nucleotide-binding universal stress UspA family protein
MARGSRITRRGFRVLVATDGSPSARAALKTAEACPWPNGTRVRGVVVSPPEWRGELSRAARPALAIGIQRIAAAARRGLARRWPDADVAVVSARPADGILREATRLAADVIVLGWRGHGTFRRLLVGSVSRSVVERARAPVLVVREVRRIVVGVDGSPNARRAVAFVARLAGHGTTVTVVRVVEPRTVPTAGRLPASIRAIALREVAMMNRARLDRARRDVESAAARLKTPGRSVRAEVVSGAPLAALLDVVDRTDAHLLVVGARAVRGVARALLGSVASGALNDARVPVLVVR